MDAQADGGTFSSIRSCWAAAIRRSRDLRSTSRPVRGVASQRLACLGGSRCQLLNRPPTDHQQLACTQRTESITIQLCADNFTISKDQCCGTIPRLLPACVLFKKHAQLRFHPVSVLPSWWNHG